MTTDKDRAEFEEWVRENGGVQQSMYVVWQAARSRSGAVPAVTDAMVSRFLSWKLPKEFAPDCGVSFTPIDHPLLWPIGTNLLHAGQAREMLEYVLAPFIAPAAAPDLCPNCKGSGETTALAGGGPDAYEVTINCPKCEGTGGAAPEPQQGARVTDGIRDWAPGEWRAPSPHHGGEPVCVGWRARFPSVGHSRFNEGAPTTEDEKRCADNGYQLIRLYEFAAPVSAPAHGVTVPSVPIGEVVPALSGRVTTRTTVHLNEVEFSKLPVGTKLYAHPVVAAAPFAWFVEGTDPLLRVPYFSVTFDRASVTADHKPLYAIPVAVQDSSAWIYDMSAAPRDSTMVELLVQPNADPMAFNPLEDSTGPAFTIGFNSADHNELGWQFVGWNWQQDCFENGHGTPVAWRHIRGAAAPSSEEQAEDALGNGASIPDSWLRFMRELAKCDTGMVSGRYVGMSARKLMASITPARAQASEPVSATADAREGDAEDDRRRRVRLFQIGRAVECEELDDAQAERLGVELQRMSRICPNCSGFGAEGDPPDFNNEGAGISACTNCDGKGEFPADRAMGAGGGK